MRRESLGEWKQEKKGGAGLTDEAESRKKKRGKKSWWTLQNLT